MSDKPFGNPRDIARRVRARGQLELRSACHVGGPDADATTDRPILRDPTGVPYIPGTTVKGVLRAHLAEIGCGDLAQLAFGGEWGDEEGKQARLIVEDARLDGGSVQPELRDGVAIDPALGIAKDKHKFDIELLPAGTRFTLGFELLLPVNVEDETNLKAALLHCMSALEESRVNLGARTRRGLGRVGVRELQRRRWDVEEYATGTLDGLLHWLASPEIGQRDAWHGAPASAEHFATVKEVAARWQIPLGLSHRPPEFALRLELAVAGSVLVRAEATDAADAEHLKSRGPDLEQLPILPGTSIAGRLRHRCLRIARTMGDGDEATRLVEGLFGPQPSRDTNTGDEQAKKSRGEQAKKPPAVRANLCASRVRVADAYICGARTLRHTRTRIDPWTGAAADGLLFTTDPSYGGEVDIEIEIDRRRVKGDPQHPAIGAEARREPADARKAAEAQAADAVGRALLLLAVRDLVTGDLPIGGEGGTGRGRLKPRDPSGRFGTIEYANGKVTLTLTNDGAVSASPSTLVDADFEHWRRWAKVQPVEVQP